MPARSTPFLEKVTEQRPTLSAWVRASVSEMDAIMGRGFPDVFGKNWRQKMINFPTSARTKLLTYVFDYAIEEMARRMNVEYVAANNEGKTETNNFDCYLFGHTVENKLSLGKDASSFGTGSSHNTEGKVSRILTVKVIQSEDYHSEKLFAAAIDLSHKKSDDTKWHTDKAKKSGFSTLKISR